MTYLSFFSSNHIEEAIISSRLTYLYSLSSQEEIWCWPWCGYANLQGSMRIFFSRLLLCLMH